MEEDMEREGDLLRVGLTVRQVDIVIVLERDRVNDGVRDKDVVRVVERVSEEAAEALSERKRVSVVLKVIVGERDRVTDGLRESETVGD